MGEREHIDTRLIGKMVSIRHASETERIVVEGYLEANQAGFDVNRGDIVVAVEERRIIGFGISNREDDTACVSVFEDSSRKGIGSAIVNHLTDYESAPRISVNRYSSVFTPSGFRIAKTLHAGRTRKTGDVCLRTGGKTLAGTGRH